MARVSEALHPIEASHLHARRERVFLILAGFFLGISTFYGSHNMYYREIKHNESKIGRYYLPKSYGFSVRCLKE
ncbi:MAG: hypothetical protein R6V49_07350 [Bacteroidales bacterium]